MSLLADFYRRTWDASATEESVHRARRDSALHNAVAPGEEVPTFLFLDGGHAVGHVTTIPIRLWDGTQERAAHWLKGLMVLPEYRNGPVGFLLLRHAVTELGCAMAFVVQPEARKLFAALGFADAGAMPNRIRLLRPAAVLRAIDLDSLPLRLPAVARRALALVRSSRALTHAAGQGVQAATALRSLGASGPAAVADGPIEDTEVNAVWTRMRSGLRAAPVRSAAALRRRYLQNGGYQAITVREHGAVAGAAFLRAPAESGDERLRGLRVATLSDLTAPLDRPDIALGLIRGAEACARRMNADALLCSGTHESLLRLLARRGYFHIPANVHLLLRDPERTMAEQLPDWWLMRGDSGADEVF